MEIEWYKSQPTLAPVQHAPAETVPARRVAIKDVADTARVDEIPVLDVSSVDQALAHYRARMHSKRGLPDTSEPTAEQLSVLAAFKESREVPHGDFALWDP